MRWFFPPGVTMASQIRTWSKPVQGQVRQAGVLGDGDAAFAAGASAVAQFEVGQAPRVMLVANAVTRLPSLSVMFSCAI